MAGRYFSYGGGVQSTAALVLAAQGKIDFPVFLFCDLGSDSENPDTIKYVDDVAIPFARANGIEFVRLKRIRRDGSVETLRKRIDRSMRTIDIPVRMKTGAPGNRKCTIDFKVKVVAKETKRRGATKDDPAVIGLGISTDEWQRASTNHTVPHQRVEYPLLDLGMSRSDCQSVIATAGIAVPPKSSCFFCPFHKMSYWIDLKQSRPDLFDESVKIERLINERRRSLDRDEVYLTGAGRPLDVITPDQPSLGLEDDGCESGYCMV